MKKIQDLGKRTKTPITGQPSALQNSKKYHAREVKDHQKKLLAFVLRPQIERNVAHRNEERCLSTNFDKCIEQDTLLPLGYFLPSNFANFFLGIILFYLQFISHLLLFPNFKKIGLILRALKSGRKKAFLRNITVWYAFYIIIFTFSHFLKISIL